MTTRTELDLGPLRELRASLAKVSDASLKVGILASKGGNAEHNDDGITMLELAAIHEFGSPAAHIPERSFIRRTFLNKRVELDAMYAKLAKALVIGRVTPQQALNLLGQWAVTAIKNTITGEEPIPPPLQPRTIARKGSTRPLVDTGRLVGAINYEVTTGG